GSRNMEQAKPRRSRCLEGVWTLVASALLVACGTPSNGLGPRGSAATSGSHDRSATAATSAGAGHLAVDGFILPVPPGWSAEDRAVIGTAFQLEARSCVSAETVDRPVPSDAGSAQLTRAAVQICVIARKDDLGLEQWLAGRGHETSTSERYGTCDVRLLPGKPELQLAYAQSSDSRAEMATTVTTTPEMAEQRRREVADLLTKLRCPVT
ncbi:hypothetical protein, partial [Nocardioides sp.]|uniref:hypothetical protein n=1 Tax=Nocardioides sp. TaxID=35761 RepID=UPI002ED97CA0